MVQFNLLPDVKLEYIRTHRTKRMVILVACGVSALCLAFFVVLFAYVNVIQPQHLKSLNNSIQTSTKQLQAVPDLDKVLTVQNQLNSLTALHAKDPATSRLFGYLGKVTPAKATISNVEIDFTANSMTISGDADAISTINKYVDTLKFTGYKVDGGDQTPQLAFSNVVLASFGKNDKSSTYQITLNFDPAIFDNTKTVSLDVPKIISTRSETEKPSDLFQKSQTNTGQNQ